MPNIRHLNLMSGVLFVCLSDNQQLSKDANLFVFYINDPSDHICSNFFNESFFNLKKRRPPSSGLCATWRTFSVPWAVSSGMPLMSYYVFTVLWVTHEKQLRNRLPLYKTCLCVCPLARSTIIRSIVSNILTTLGRRQAEEKYNCQSVFYGGLFSWICKFFTFRIWKKSGGHIFFHHNRVEENVNRIFRFPGEVGLTLSIQHVLKINLQFYRIQWWYFLIKNRELVKYYSSRKSKVGNCI